MKANGEITATTSGPKDELRALTGLRGLAALYVVIYHLTRAPFSNPFTTLIAHGYLAVDLFFVLSGFVMALNYGPLFVSRWSRQSYIKFLGRRVARIYPLYVFTSIIGLLEYVKHFGRPSALQLVSNALLIQTWGIAESFDGPSWSISSEWAAYLVFPILVAATLYGSRRHHYISATLALLILIALLFAPASLRGYHSSIALFDLAGHDFALPLFRCIAEFTLGLLAFVASRTNIGRRFMQGKANPLILFCALMVLATIRETDLLIVVIFPLLILTLSSGGSLPVRVLSSPIANYFGRISYSIYLFHGIFAFGIQQDVERISFRYNFTNGHIGGTVIATLATIPVSFLGYKFIEIPGRRIVREFFEPKAKLMSR